MSSDTQPKHALGGKLGQEAGRSDAGKRIVHTIDPDFITGIGRVSAFGAKKYHMRNFLMAPGMAWGRVFDSLIGHLFAHWGGEDLDEESGQPHILMAGWNLMVLHQYWKNPVFHPGDDRPAVIEHKGKLWTDWEKEFNAAKGNTAQQFMSRVFKTQGIDAARRHVGLPPIEKATQAGRLFEKDDMSTKMDEWTPEAALDRCKAALERADRVKMEAVGVNPRDLRSVLNAADTWMNTCHTKATTFEYRLADALKELEELGFKMRAPDFKENVHYEGQAWPANEHGEDPYKVLSDYAEFGEPAPMRLKPRNPEFLKDPIRAFYAAKNKGDAK